MKRMIDGKAYNTETSAMILKTTEAGCTRTYYQTRGGAYFAHDVPNEDGPTRFLEASITPVEEEKVRQILEAEKKTQQLARIFEVPNAGEPETKVYVRVPDSLKRDLEATAEERDISLNTLAIRCFEMCCNDRMIPVEDKYQFFNKMAGAYYSLALITRPEKRKLTLEECELVVEHSVRCIDALLHMIGVDDLSKVPGGEMLGNDVDVMELKG